MDLLLRSLSSGEQRAECPRSDPCFHQILASLLAVEHVGYNFIPQTLIEHIRDCGTLGNGRWVVSMGGKIGGRTDGQESLSLQIFWHSSIRRKESSFNLGSLEHLVQALFLDLLTVSGKRISWMLNLKCRHGAWDIDAGRYSEAARYQAGGKNDGPGWKSNAERKVREKKRSLYIVLSAASRRNYF